MRKNVYRDNTYININIDNIDDNIILCAFFYRNKIGKED